MRLDGRGFKLVGLLAREEETVINSVGMALAIHPQVNALTWMFYRRVRNSPDPDGYDASTGYKLAYTAAFRQHGTVASVTSVTTTLALDPLNTWVVTSAVKPVRHGEKDPLLEHERLHWRIDRLVGNELDAELRSVGSAPTMDELSATMDNLVIAKTLRAQSISQAYDDETRHGENAAKQTLWVNRVVGWEGANKITWP
jgi:hypothetical protein